MSKAEERQQFPLVYTGPSTAAGLQKNARCRYARAGKGRGAAGGRMIQTQNGRRWLVAASHLERKP